MLAEIETELAQTDRLLNKKGIPNALYSEQVILGAILAGVTEFDEVDSTLHPESFSLEKHRRIYQAMRELHAKNARVCISAIGQHLKDQDKIMSVDGLSYLTELLDYVPPMMDASYHIEVIDERARAASFIGTVLQEVNAVIAGGDYEKAKDAILQTCQKVQGHVDKRMYDAVEIAGSQINTFFGRQEAGLNTGISLFDSMTYGLHKQELVVIGGAPGSLKTSLATQICARVAGTEKQRAHIISLEMSKEQLLQRTCCQIAGVPFHLVRSGDITAEQRVSVMEAFTQLADSPLYIDDSVDWNLVKIRSHLKHQALIGNPVRLLAIDYLQLMPVMQIRKDRRDLEIGEITRGLKLMSREFDLTVILLSQLSRDFSKMNRKPVKSDLKESSSIEQDADVIALLWHDMKKDFENYREAEIILEKQRNGPTGPIPVYFDKRSVSFTDR